MCGCAGGGASVSAATRARTLVQTAPVTPPQDCIYTIDMVYDWLTKVNCFRDNGYYANTSITIRQLNIYLGTLKSARNYPTNICYYQTQLAAVQSFITALASMNTPCSG